MVLIMNEPPQIPFKELVLTSAPLRRELNKVYEQLPVIRCDRQVNCCSLLPEMTFLEALHAMSTMFSWPSSDRITTIKKIIRYFLCNAVEISSCPFLQGQDCLIYPDRFFGCRAYGLWSRKYYRDFADKNRQGKLFLKQHWEKLGISLPEEVLSFEVPYCSRVESDIPGIITDALLSAAADRIEKLSGDLEPWDRDFRENYFSDLSFFLTGLQFGTQEAVRLKYFVTRDIILNQDRTRLDQALSRVIDFIQENR
ncbi:MAG: hypothetical protein AB1585_16350 [Thermodesulfobacteriota bacterium]